MAVVDFFLRRPDGRAGVVTPTPLGGSAQKPMTPLKATTLAGVIGTAAASIVLAMTPMEESGRKVEVTFNQDGSANLKHISGKQYLQTYIDIVGVKTYCDGLTKGAKLGQRYTEQQCATLLEDELVSTAKAVMACSSGLRADKAGFQRAGSTVMAYNIGNAGWCGSTARKKLDAGQIIPAGDAMMSWNKGHIKGVLTPIKGLTDRRCRERAVFVTGQPGFPPATMQQRIKACTA